MKFGTRSALTPAGWESMVALLDPLRLYDLSPESFVSRELMAYAAGLALFRQRLERRAGTICSLPPAVWNGWPDGRNCWICRWPVPMRPAAGRWRQ